MKLGTENRTQLIVLAVLGAIGLLLLARTFWPSAPAAPVSQTVSSGPAKPSMRRTASGKLVAEMEPRLDPTLDFESLRQSEQIKYEGNGRNIFAIGAPPIPVAVARGITDQPAVYTPPPPPPPPPITMKFFGFAGRPGEAKKVFLVQGEDVFIAGEGDIVNRRYRILHISTTPPSVDVEDVLNNNRQSLPMVQG
ncbi:MAG TPA: hypothetical protein VEK84_13675 [Terriglobales bacterium]|nr:hypothetical protein [Terriglobales bacterium]